ncbi:MAG: glycosyltransferase family 2 protein [Candidatus Omnitrophica bacterium]|nr:glycosyltransferase family 2 protein [Candidatus Omnitrophota bacterium]
MKLSILLLCLNEKATIAKAIEQAKQITIDKEIIVIDNYSTDGSRELLKAYQQDKQVRVVLHEKNMGPGFSMREGISLSQGEYFYAPGGDLEYEMNDVYKMFEKLINEKQDGVFGSRLLVKQGVSKLALIRERPYWLGTMIATFLINLLYGRHFTDIIATKLIKTNILQGLRCQASNQSFEFEMVSMICKNRFRIAEVPVGYKPRTHKEGKTIKVLDMLPAILVILKIKFFARLNK